jgi:hypothetical protein
MVPCRLLLLGLALGACVAEEASSHAAAVIGEQPSSFLQTGHGHKHRIFGNLLKSVGNAIGSAVKNIFGPKKKKEDKPNPFLEAVPKDLYGPWAHMEDPLKVSFPRIHDMIRADTFSLAQILPPRFSPCDDLYV